MCLSQGHSDAWLVWKSIRKPEISDNLINPTLYRMSHRCGNFFSVMLRKVFTLSIQLTGRFENQYEAVLKTRISQEMDIWKLKQIKHKKLTFATYFEIGVSGVKDESEEAFETTLGLFPGI